MFTWNENNTISVEQTKKSKKITGTRLAGILGNNKWKTPFAIFCEMTHTYEEPFRADEYTCLGNVIEPLQCNYLGQYLLKDVERPEVVYDTPNFFDLTHGDFYPDEKVFGGMWDALIYDDDTPIAVVECKTTQRPEDWVDEKGNVVVPVYYALQGSLYAYLLGLDDVYIIVSFPTYKNYVDMREYIKQRGEKVADTNSRTHQLDKLVNFRPSESNTQIIHFKVSEQYPNFKELLEQATEWYNEHILTGISPEYDEEKDKDILKELRKKVVDPNTSLTELLARYEEINSIIEEQGNAYESLEDELDKLRNEIKNLLAKDLNDENQIYEVSTSSTHNEFIVRKTVTEQFDTKKFREEHPDLYNEYLKPTERIALYTKEVKK